MKIADKPGVYKDFSGKINWKETVCVVRNADFEILEKYNNEGKCIIFDDVVFVSGKVWWSVIKNALNLGCDFRYCDIEYMIHKGGKILYCEWCDGIFEDGIFRYGIWYDGTWISGVWEKGKNSKGKTMALPPDQWEKE